MTDHFLTERERAFEAQFAHDQELAFRVMARRDKLLAGWAATRLTMGAEDHTSLERDLLALHGGTAHDATVGALLKSRLSSAGVAVTDEEVSAAMNAAMTEARRQLMDSTAA